MKDHSHRICCLPVNLSVHSAMSFLNTKTIICFITTYLTISNVPLMDRYPPGNSVTDVAIRMSRSNLAHGRGRGRTSCPCLIRHGNLLTSMKEDAVRTRRRRIRFTMGKLLDHLQEKKIQRTQPEKNCHHVSRNIDVIFDKAVQVRQTFGCEMWQLKTKTMTHRTQRLSVSCLLRWRLSYGKLNNGMKTRTSATSSRRRTLQEEGLRRHPRQGAQADPHRYCGEVERNQCGTLGSHQVHLVVDTDILMRVARKKGEHEMLCPSRTHVTRASTSAHGIAGMPAGSPAALAHLHHDGACNSLQLLLFSETKKCILHVLSPSSPELVLDVFPLWECFARWKKSSPHQSWPQSLPC